MILAIACASSKHYNDNMNKITLSKLEKKTVEGLELPLSVVNSKTEEVLYIITRKGKKCDVVASTKALRLKTPKAREHLDERLSESGILEIAKFKNETEHCERTGIFIKKP